jgi:hypothetical protein
MLEKITPQATVLDVVSSYRQTEKVFRAYDRVAGECICCNCLFCTLEEIAKKYGIDLKNLLHDLKSATET